MAEMNTNGLSKSQINTLTKAQAIIGSLIGPAQQGAQGSQAVVPQQPKRGPGRPAKVQSAPVQDAPKRGPGRPRKDAAAPQNHTTIKSNTAPRNNTQGNQGSASQGPKQRGRVPVLAPLMHDAMITIAKGKGGNGQVTFEQLKQEMTNRANAKKDPVQAFSDTTMRQYLSTYTGKLWERVGNGIYVPNNRVAA